MATWARESRPSIRSMADASTWIREMRMRIMEWKTMVHGRRARIGVAMSLVGASMACVGKPVAGWYAPELPITSLANVTVTPPAAILAVGGTTQVSLSGRTFQGA